MPLEEVFDPTGAGDTFAGGFLGYLASCDDVDDAALARAIIYGSTLASFAVEDFSVDRLLRLTRDEVDDAVQRVQAADALRRGLTVDAEPYELCHLNSDPSFHCAAGGSLATRYSNSLLNFLVRQTRPSPRASPARADPGNRPSAAESCNGARCDSASSRCPPAGSSPGRSSDRASA